MRSDSIIKEGRRRRYIGFNISTIDKKPITKDDLIDAVRMKCSTLFKKDFRDMELFILRFNGEKGIIRCKHLEKENTIKLLISIEKIGSKKVKIDTIATSGTIKSLVNKHMIDLKQK